MARRGTSQPDVEIPTSAKRWTIALGIVALILTVVGFIGAIPPIVSTNDHGGIVGATDGAVQNDVATSAIFLGIGTIGLLAGVVWVYLVRRQRRGE